MAETQSKCRTKAMNFADLGITVGTVLTYRKSEKTCTVVDTKNKVEYEGQVYTLSGLAKKLVGTQASGFATFYKDGVRLSALAHKTPMVRYALSGYSPTTAAKIAPTGASDGAQSTVSTQDAPQAATSAEEQGLASTVTAESSDKTV